MRIGIFTDAYEPYISGVTTSIKMLKEVLENMHHEVYIVTANLKRYKFEYDKKNKIVYIPGIKTGIYDSRLTSIYSRKAMKIIKKWNLDIIHSQTEFGIGAFSRIVSKKLNIPVVHTYHTLYEDYLYYITHGRFEKLSQKIALKITKYYTEKKCDALIVPTDKIKDLFVNKYHITKNINIIPTGIDTKKFELTLKMEKEIKQIRKKYQLKDNDFIIGAVGRIAKEKSFDKLLIAMKDLIKQDKNIKLLIIGKGPAKEELENLAKSLNIENNIIFTGPVSYDLMPSYYNTFNCLTSFSKTETQGLTIIEALASSIPTVCINDKSFIDVIKNNYNGYLFNNQNEFINYIIDLKENKKLYNEMTINAKKSIYNYTKEAFANNILKVYSKAIQKINK